MLRSLGMSTITIPSRNVGPWSTGILAVTLALSLWACKEDTASGGGGSAGETAATSSTSTGSTGSAGQGGMGGTTGGLSCGVGGAVLILPELTSVEPKAEGMALAWKSAHPCANEIRRSQEGGAYEALVEVPAIESCAPQSYTYVDTTATATGAHYCYVVRCWGGDSNELCADPAPPM